MVWLFPSYGMYDESKSRWRVHVTGAVFRPSVVRIQKRLSVRLLRQAMKVSSEAFESEVFRQRISPFISAPHRGRRLALSIQDQLFRLPRKSRRNGHFRAKLWLEPQEIETIFGSRDTWLDVETWRDDKPQPTIGGRVQLLAPHGVSVVSDIDDTIKESGVGCRTTLLANTFLNDFQAVNGMADVYQRWAEGGAAFHYVSSSPWQLFAPLERWRVDAGFPEGTFHLRQFRLGDHMMRRLLRIRRQGKGRIIQQMLRRFPQRKFILVGDSSEHDPEIYGALARRYPDQVALILLRNLPGNALTFQRAEKALRGIAPSKCQCYRDPLELPLDLAQFIGGSLLAAT